MRILFVTVLSAILLAGCVIPAEISAKLDQEKGTQMDRSFTPTNELTRKLDDAKLKRQPAAIL